MKKILFLILFLTPSIAFAEYCVSEKNGAVWVHYGANKTCEKYSEEIGENYKVVSSLPDKTDRKYWKIVGNSVVIDQAKKQADIDKALQEKAAKDAILLKLKITKEELEKLK